MNAEVPGPRLRRAPWRLPARDTTGLRRAHASNAGALADFAVETRRAEMVHWAIPLVTPVFVLWNPPWLFAAMVGYAVVANLPCLVIQRYNRGRVLRVADRRARSNSKESS